MAPIFPVKESTVVGLKLLSRPWAVWKGLEAALGTSLIGQLLSVGLALGLGVLVYARLTLVMRVPEARQIRGLVAGELRGRVTG